MKPDYLVRIHELTKWLEALLAVPGVRYAELKPSQIPETGGVYLIEIEPEARIVYVGTTGNLRNRVYGRHLHGDSHAAQVKNALVKFGYGSTHQAAKEFMKANCLLRVEAVPDYREREMKEGFAKAILKPEFSLYKSKEH